MCDVTYSWDCIETPFSQINITLSLSCVDFTQGRYIRESRVKCIESKLHDLLGSSGRDNAIRKRIPKVQYKFTIQAAEARMLVRYTGEKRSDDYPGRRSIAFIDLAAFLGRIARLPARGAMTTIYEACARRVDAAKVD